MKALFFFALIFLGGCNNKPDNSSVSKNQIVHVKWHKKPPPDIIVKRTPDVLLNTNPKIFADISVYATDSNNIFATVTIINNTDSLFSLYKPILPSDSLKENDFSIFNLARIDTSDFEVAFLPDSINDHVYLADDADLLPFISPVLEDENIIFLFPHSQLYWKTNIANKYDFKSAISKGQNKFSIAYIVFMPFIINLKLQQELYPVDSLYKPVFIGIGSNPLPPERPKRFVFSVPLTGSSIRNKKK